MGEKTGLGQGESQHLVCNMLGRRSRLDIDAKQSPAEAKGEMHAGSQWPRDGV